ncbi:MAG: hypothetical protein WAN57_07695, partial [Smithella sp.]
MSLSDRNNPYKFDNFLDWRQNFDYYRDDPFIQKAVRHFTGGQWETIDSQAREISVKASFRWRDFAENIARPEKRPFMLHYDGHHNRIDRIVRPQETEI